MSPQNYQKQIDFIFNEVLVPQWSQFANLAILDYAFDENAITEFGIFNTLGEVEKYVRSIKQSTSRAYLCDALVALSLDKTAQAYAILFMSKFTNGFDDKCGNDYDTVANQLSGLTVVNLSESVNTDRLKQEYPFLNIISWNIEKDDKPANVEQQFWRGFGCEGRSTLLPPYESTTEGTSTKLTTLKTTLPETTTVTTTQKGVTKNGLKTYLAIFVPLGILLFWTVLICFFLYRRKQKRKREDLKDALRDGYAFKVKDNQYDQKADDPWEILAENVLVNYENRLGSGAFGIVYSGRLVGDAAIRNIYRDSPLLAKFHDCKIAIKTLPAHVDDWARNDFQQEMNFMKSLKFHANVLCMLGFVQDPTSPLLILEFCANGDLLQFLRKNKDKFSSSDEEQGFKVKNLISFAWQVSNGLEYLSSLDHIHRDVAARNILLDKNNICKISDFGMCRNSDSQIYTSRGGKLPVRWMAIESLTLYEYSSKSDVWSFGVLLFELFSLGQVPYFKFKNDDILQFLQEGKRLDKPELATDEIYEIMLSCWRSDPNERPTFTEICTQFIPMLEIGNESYNYVDAVQIDLPESDGETDV